MNISFSLNISVILSLIIYKMIYLLLKEQIKAFRIVLLASFTFMNRTIKVKEFRLACF